MQKRSWNVFVAVVSSLALMPIALGQTWHPETVNARKADGTPGGAQCLVVLSGVAGVCWPTSEARTLEQAILAELPALRLERDALARQAGAMTRQIEAMGQEVGSLRGAGAADALALQSYRTALVASDKRANLLERAAGWGFWAVVGGFVLGAALTVGLSYATRR